MQKFVGDSMRGGLSTAHAETTTVSDMAKASFAVPDATIDFRMLRRAYVERVRSGDVPQHDACDATIDLVRAAQHHGVARRAACPVCAAHELRNVTYLFGPRLPKSGKCVTSTKVLHEADERPEQFTAYTVEVCLQCRWNHVLAAVPHGGRRRRSAARSRTASRRRA